MTKRKSVYSLQYWLDKGYSKEEGEYQIKIRRPTNYEYYVHKFGLCEEDAKKQVSEFSKRASNNVKNYCSPRTLQYWLNKGLTVVNAKNELKKIQSTFSYEKCVKKYGKIEGEKRWKERQEKWQKTLNEKPLQEKKRINLSKNSIKFEYEKYLKGEKTLNEVVETLNKVRNMNLVSTEPELYSYIQQKIIDNPDMFYYSAERLSNKIANIQFLILDINDKISYMNQFVYQGEDKVYFSSRSKNSSYRMWVGKKLLRSSYEIYFYKLLCKNKFQFKIDDFYPNSRKRFDFYLIDYDLYIEISPDLENRSEKYKTNIQEKLEKFNCIVLTESNQFSPFIQEVLSGKFSKRNS